MILRVYLDADGNVIGRRTLGRLYNAAIKLSPDECVEQGLHIAPTIEAGLRALSNGLAPTWVVLGQDAVASFRLSGVELTVIADDGGM